MNPESDGGEVRRAVWVDVPPMRQPRQLRRQLCMEGSWLCMEGRDDNEEFRARDLETMDESGVGGRRGSGGLSHLAN